MSGDANGKPTPSYKEILRSKDKAVSEANTLLKGERKNRKNKDLSVSEDRIEKEDSYKYKKIAAIDRNFRLANCHSDFGRILCANL